MKSERKLYTGVGSRETPQKIQDLMANLASEFHSLGYVLRSGAAEGADVAFEKGAGKQKEIYLPWNGFRGRRHGVDGAILYTSNEALKMAIEHHPAGEKMSPVVRSFMTRNVFQVLGMNLDSPSEVVICWTRDGCESAKTRRFKTGGTGQAIAVASSLGIPVINLANNDALARIEAFLNRLKTL